MAESSLPVLSGLRVLDAGTTIAGPFAGTLLADLGADVISLEKPRVGDPIRAWFPMKDGISLWWKVSARNKRLITLDLSKSRGREIFLELVRVSDAVIENFRPGTFDRWGLSYETLAEANPGIIVVRISGYGQTGPYAKRPGYGTVAEAMSGIPSFTGFPGGPPTLSAYPFADMVAGTFGVVGLLSALRERESNDGRGQEVDVSLFESCFRLIESQVIGYDQLRAVKERKGNRFEEDSPRNAYESSDGAWIAISASSDQTFARLAAAISRPELAQDERFQDNIARIANNDELDRIIGQWIGARSAEEVMEAFERNDVVAGKIYSIADIFEDAQYRARNAIVSVADDDFGEVRMQDVFPRFSRSSTGVRWAGGTLGQHNAEIYADLLGMSAAEYEQLTEAGVC